VKRVRNTRSGFTLAEVAITLLIVGIGLVAVLQGLLRSELSAAETHYRKVALQLAEYKLAQVEGGLMWEDLDEEGGVQSGSYAEEGYDDYSYELAFGEDEFPEDNGRFDRDTGYHDSWEYERERQDRLKDDDEEKVEEPFEKVRIKVFYPQLGERPNSLVLERWIPWEQVYGASEDGKSAKTGVSE